MAGAPQKGKEGLWLSFPSLSTTNPIRRETMSDGEFEHILVQEIIKHQFHTFT